MTGLLKRKGAVLLIVLALLPGIADQALAQPDKKVVRVFTKTEKAKEILSGIGAQIEYRGLKPYVDVLVDSMRLEKIRQRGFQFKELPALQKANLYDPIYHTYEEVKAELDSLAQKYPDITQVVQIGESQQFHYPIWSIKISDNADQDEDEFTVNFDGMHHAREPMGMETCMLLINHLLQNYGSDPLVTQMVNEIEIWVTPILNVEGYKYLVDEDLSDPWWRKNLRDNNENGKIDPQVDGVDLNRNYDFRFLSGGSPEFSSWNYRGPYPFSEGETRAKRDLALRERFLCSITYHSYAEEIYYMRGLDGNLLPEAPVADEIADSLARLIPNLDRTGTYDPGGSTGATNMSYPWMFAVVGTYEYLIELGREHIPPGSVARSVARDNLPAALYLLKKTLQGPGIVVHVTDAVTGQPVEATVKVLEYFRPPMTPRKTDAVHGRLHRFAAPGTYTLLIQAPGYKPQKLQNVAVNASGWTTVDVALTWGGTPVVTSVLVDDDSTGQSRGNSNGQFDISETVELAVALQNVGKVALDSLQARLSSGSSHVRVLQAVSRFDSLAPDSMGWAKVPFVLQADALLEDGSSIPLRLLLTTADGLEYETEFSLTVSAPQLTLRRVVVHDASGNSNGALEAGETADIEVVFHNSGHSPVTFIRGVLSENDAYLATIARVDTLDIIPAGAEGSLFFQVTLDNQTPDPYLVPLKVSGITQEQFRFSQSWILSCLPGFFDNMELGENGWWSEVHGLPDNFHNDWQLGTPAGEAGGTDPAAAYSGNSCWGNDLGGPDWNGYYQHNVDILLHSPVIDCSRYEQVGLQFMRWLNVRDGDLAEVWVNDQVVWSNNLQGMYEAAWTRQQLDISPIADHNDSVVVSFRLKTNDSGWAGGWNIDDVLVRAGLLSEVTQSEVNGLPAQFHLFQNYPNPVVGKTQFRYALRAPGEVTLELYNLLGQKVATLVQRTQDAGFHTFQWDLSQRKLANGVYFVVLHVTPKTGPEFRAVRKLMILR